MFDKQLRESGHRIIEGFGKHLHAIGINDEGRIVMFFKKLPSGGYEGNTEAEPGATGTEQRPPEAAVAG